MKTDTCQRYERQHEEYVTTNNIIYLYDPKRATSRHKRNVSDVIWNVLFVGLCLSVLIVLFLH